jgi:hypothetical protein
LCIALVGFVAANDASGNSTNLAVAGHVTGNAPDDGTLDATLRFDCGRGARKAQYGGDNEQRSHF